MNHMPNEQKKCEACGSPECAYKSSDVGCVCSCHGEQEDVLLSGLEKSRLRDERKEDCIWCKHNKPHPPHTPTEEKIKIVPSPRLDWCGACKKEHGYDCPLDTPTVSKWEEEFDEEYGNEPLEIWAVGFVATVLTQDQIRPRFGEGSDRSFLTRKLVKHINSFLSSKIDIDEVIGMIEGMRQEKHEITEDDFRPRDCSCPACYSAGCFNLALSSLKQKLEAKRKEK